jgi:hypothetical protein
MRRAKGRHRITVNGVEYRWRATGNDGWISIGIWPTNNTGAFINGTFRYHSRPGEQGDRPVDTQIIITNRITKRIIELAMTKYDYDPGVKASQLNLGPLDEVIKWDDAVRGTKF